VICVEIVMSFRMSFSVSPRLPAVSSAGMEAESGLLLQNDDGGLRMNPPQLSSHTDPDDSDTDDQKVGCLCRHLTSVDVTQITDAGAKAAR